MLSKHCICKKKKNKWQHFKINPINVLKPNYTIASHFSCYLTLLLRKSENINKKIKMNILIKRVIIIY